MAVQQTTQQTILPAWYTDYAKTLYGRALGASEQPYYSYDLPRIAGFQPEQEQAFSGFKSSMGEYQPILQEAVSGLQRGTGSFTDPGVAQQYMNPYIEQVVSGIGQTAGRNLYENILPQINRTFVGGGTFGGSRSQEFMNRAVRDTQAAALSEQNKAMMAGYDTAAGQFNTEASRRVTAAPYMGSLAEQAQTQRMRELGGLEAIGAQKQQLAQTSADLSYQDFLAQRDYPFTQLERMVGVTGTPSATGQTQVNQSPAPSKASQIGGLLTSGIGILGATGAFGKGGWLGLKNGGKASAKKQKAKQAKTGLGWLKD